MEPIRQARPIILATLGALLSVQVAAEDGRCTTWAARLESLEGNLTWRSDAQQPWQSSARLDEFCYGDIMRLTEGRATLRLSNDTLVKLNAGTTIRLAPEDQSFLVELFEGAGYFFSRTLDPLTVKTPYLNAAVDGTEFLTAATETHGEIAVFEGQVRAINEDGTLTLNAGERTRSTARSAPTQPVQVSIGQAATWALYFPPVVVRAEVSPNINAAIARGDYRAALADITGNSTAQPADTAALGASLALLLGDVDRARALLVQARQQEDQHLESLALESLIAITQGEHDDVHQQLQTLADQHSDNVTVLSVLSYSWQSQADLPQALQAAEQALTLDPQSALLRARVAELLLASGHQRRANRLISDLLETGVAFSRFHTLAGFSALNQFDTRTALSHFQRAVSMDDSDPQAFLGMGLAHIRQNELEAGREFLELAVVLDPTNSLARSYLGKTYYEEQRLDQAGAQYELAKHLDPDDPTPWFYDAHLKQAENSYPESVRLMERAIEKNDNRGVYRSQLMLNADEASRSAGLTRSYHFLGADTLARITAANAITKSPTDYAGHSAMTTALSVVPRHEGTRISEALQTSIFQPLGAQPLPLGTTEGNLKALSAISPARMGLHEYSPLFASKGLRGFVSGMAGNDDTHSLEGQAQWLMNSASITAAHYQYLDNDRPSRFAEYRVSEVEGHLQPMESLNIIASASQTNDIDNELEHSTGDDRGRSREIEEQDLKVRYQFGPDRALLFHAHNKNIDSEEFNFRVFDEMLSANMTTSYYGDFDKIETAFIAEGNLGWVKLGAFELQSIEHKHEHLSESFLIGETRQIVSEHSFLLENNEVTRKIYAEAYLPLYNDRLSASLGVATIPTAPTNIKIRHPASASLDWNFNHKSSFNIAYWEDISLPKTPFLESASISVFPRREDGRLHSSTQTMAAHASHSYETFSKGIEARVGRTFFQLPSSNESGEEFLLNQSSISHRISPYIYWPLNKTISIAAKFGWEKEWRKDPQEISEVYTRSMPITIAWSPAPPWSIKATGTIFSQKLLYLSSHPIQHKFFNLDVSTHWRHPKIPLGLTLGVFNILGKDTQYRSGSISMSGLEHELGFQEFSDERAIILRSVFNF